MNIYIAALRSNGYCHTNRYLKLNNYEKSIVDNQPFLLESYHYIQKESYVQAIREKGDKIFLDSGAFSAHTLGVKLDVSAYCNYIKRNIDILRVEDDTLIASVLDGIGDPQETYENQLKMESFGVRPLPCFHAGEDTRYLEWYIKNYEYITLGGMVGSSTKQLTIWLDRMWEKYLTDGSGNPRLKVHGFGITSLPLMERYPWWSCDSSSWIQSASFGTVISPQWGTLSVSTKSPSRHTAGQHVANFTPAEHKLILDHFKSQGFEYERLSTVYESRAVYNIWAFNEINKELNREKASVFQTPQPELF